MDGAEKLSLEAIGRFVLASEDLGFEAQDRQQLYDWVEQVLVGQQYAQLGKAARGLVRRYVENMSGLSRAQVTRLIARYTASGRVQMTVFREAFQRLPEGCLRGCFLCACVDRREAQLRALGPVRHQPPSQQSEFPLAVITVQSDNWLDALRRDVEARRKPRHVLKFDAKPVGEDFLR